MTRDPREAWKTLHQNFRTSASARERFHTLVQYAVLAPSSHNTQPWLFRMRGETLELCADRRRAMPEADPDDRALMMSCGAAHFYLRLAMRHFGYEPEVDLFPEGDDRDLVARIAFGPRCAISVDEERLFGAIPHRHTNRQQFQPTRIPFRVLLELEDAVRREGAWLRIVRDEDQKASVANLIARGDRQQAARPRFRRELARWIHANEDGSRVGMPGYAHSLGAVASRFGPFVIRNFDWGSRRASRNRELAVDSPALLVVGTHDDSPTGWLRAGQAVARLLLLATDENVSASFLNQPIENPELRRELTRQLGDTRFPQLLLRIGYGASVRPTPRMTADEALVPY